MPIEAVIFDYGKVLSNPEDPDAQRKLIALTGLERPDFDHHYWRHRNAYNQGHLNGRAYWEKIAGDAGCSFTPGQIEELIETDVLMWTSLNEEMLCWVIALQEANIKTAILSNMCEDCLAYMHQEFEWLGRLQQLTWSCELGICKPDPAIYLHTCGKLKVAPQQALFLDDHYRRGPGRSESHSVRERRTTAAGPRRSRPAAGAAGAGHRSRLRAGAPLEKLTFDG